PTSSSSRTRATSGSSSAISTSTTRIPARSTSSPAELGDHPPPVGNYEPYVLSGELVAISAISSAREGTMITGKVGRDLSFEDGCEAARRAAENLLAVLLDAAG